jgi:hypothetical protein
MQNAKIQDLTPIIEHLFWWVPEKERTSLSDDSIVEAVLSNGDEKMVKQLFDVFGIEKVAETFNRQISGRRINYRPRTVNYFRLYFQRHAQRHPNGKAGQTPPPDQGILPGLLSGRRHCHRPVSGASSLYRFCRSIGFR